MTSQEWIHILVDEWEAGEQENGDVIEQAIEQFKLLTSLLLLLLMIPSGRRWKVRL